MSWLERARRREVGPAAPSDVLVKQTTDVEPAQTRFAGADALDYYDAALSHRSRWRRCLAFIFRPLPSFFIFVVLPSLAVIYYYAAIATDQYIAESRFVVRQVEDTSFAKGTIKLDSQGGGDNKEEGATSPANGTRKTSIATDDKDAYVVANYIGSDAIIDSVSEDLKLTDLFRRPEADFWTRLEDDASEEDLKRYWSGMVNAYVDRPSGIITLDVRAFRREDALMLQNAILASSSKLLNTMSMRARDDALKRAGQEVNRADQNMRQAMAELQNFRNHAGLIDPIGVAADTSDLLKQLLSRRISTDAELYVLKKMRPNAPTIPTLKERLKALDARISELQSTLTAKGNDTRTISSKLVGYDQLELKQDLAKEIYIEARTAEEGARQSAQGRWLYLALFDPPTLPDDSEYPHRFGFAMIAVALFFSLWSIAALIWASVLDHRA